jgi:TonB-dependent starch-binding outer membrane protein SusC
MYALLGFLTLFTVVPASHAATPDDAPLLRPAPVDARIAGKVVDENGEGVAGATVKVKGTTTGALTDVDGNFTIEASAGATLEISYTGYEPQEFVVGAQTSGLVLALKPSANTLNDVVIIGYGAVRKSDLTASVSTVKSRDLQAFPVASVDQALSARATGVNVTQASGAPGGAISVRIRGSNSIIAGAEPLYVIDGIPIYSDNDAYSAGGNRVASNALASLNPADIESVEILKDASGTAIYGSRGSNGVVLITTKRGKEGQTSVSYDGAQGFATVARGIDMLNAGQYMEYQNLRARSRNQSAPFSASQVAAAGQGINWLDETTQTAMVSNHNLSFTGGTNKFTFAIMPGYFKQEGIIQNTGFERYSLRANVEAKFLNDRLRIGSNSQMSRGTTDAIPTDRGGPGGAIITILGQSPVGPVFNPDGSYHLEAYDGRFQTNPLAEVLEVIDRDRTSRYLGNNYVSLQLMKGLTLRSSFGFDIYGANRETYYSSKTRLGRERNRSYELGQRNVFNFLNENMLFYSKKTGIGQLDVTAGYTYQTDNNRNFGIQVNDFTFDDININRLENGVKPQVPFSSRNEWVLKSYVGRVNYAIKDKYLVTATFRRDGSSKFGTNNKWANFPSVAVGWRVKEENFLKGVDAISNLKVRASWGITGNSQIPIGNSVSQLSGNNNPLFGGVVAPGVAETRLGNPDLRWETTRMVNLGFDLGFVQDKLNFTLDMFNTRTSDLLLFVALPPTSGFSSVLQNSGELENKGVELTMNALAISTRDLRLDFTVNASTVQNKILSLANTPPFYSYTVSHLGPEGSYVTAGQPIGGWYGFDAIGIWQSADEIRNNPSLDGIDKPGYVRYRDVNGDGKLDNSDRTWLGDPNPRFVWGANTNLSYKGFDFNLFFRGAHGQKIRNLQASEHADGVGNYNQFANVLTEAWSENNRSGTRPIIDATREFPSFFRRSDFFIEDGSFVRLQNVALGYTLKNIKGVKNLRVYVSGQNLALWTKYTGFDPEVSNGGQSPLNRGDDYDAYPRAKTVTVGVQVGL